MGTCSLFAVACLFLAFPPAPVADSSRFDNVVSCFNATFVTHAAELENSSLFRYLSTQSQVLEQYVLNVSGIELVEIIAADIENEIKNLGEVLKRTAGQLVERYEDKRDEVCCHNNCYGSAPYLQPSACPSVCQKNMTSLLSAYKSLTDSNFSDSQLRSHPNFEVGINASEVALYTPANILVDGRETLCSLEWMDTVGDLFKSNRNNTLVGQSASFQYFASANGSMAFYPATNWVKSNPCPRCPKQAGDSYDARQRPWYTQTIQGSVYLVILLDMSGSMTGFRSLLARLTSAELLKTLTENDFFFVIHVDRNPKPFGCFNQTQIRASRKNILSMNSLITADNLPTEGSADFLKGLNVSFEALKESTECHIVMVIFADDDTEIKASEVKEYTNSTDQQVRIFTFQVGTSGENTELKAIALNNGGIFRQLTDYTDIFPIVNDFGWELRRVSMQHGSSVFFNRYRDTFDNLVVSLSTPVIHQGNTSTFLGVMGIDVPLKTLSYIIQRQLGITGYGFVLDNNGQLVTHPLLKKGWPVLPDGLVSLDMERFEIPDKMGALRDLRRAMLHREKGNLSVATWVPANRVRRAHYIPMNTTYFYAPINGTSFSVALAMPSGVHLSGAVLRDYSSVVPAGNGAGYFVLEDLPYCSPVQLSRWDVDPIKQPKLFLETLRNVWNSSNTLCNRTLCDPLLADYITVTNISLEQSEANESWFVQFSSGMTWCAHNGTNITCNEIATTSYLSLLQDAAGPMVIAGVGSSIVVVTPIKATSDMVTRVALGKLIPQLLPNVCDLKLGDLTLLDSSGNVVGSEGTELSSVAMEILVAKHVFTEVQFTGFELTPCSLMETTAGQCQPSAVSQMQTSCEAYPKDATSYYCKAPCLCYTKLTLHRLQTGFENRSTSIIENSTSSVQWARLYGHLVLVAMVNNSGTYARSVGVSAFNVFSCLDCEVYRVPPWDSAFCNITRMNTGASWAILPQLSIVLSMVILPLAMLP